MPRRPRQGVGVATGAWLGLRNFRSRQKILVWPQDLTELCHDIAILCCNIVSQVGKVFYHNRGLLGRDRVGQARSFLSRQSWPR